MEPLCHPFPPVYDSRSRILILGSFPSVKSREVNFFYGHPQNRFWRVIAAVLGEPVPQDIPQKRRLVLEHCIAMWDTIAACEITGSSDASIRNAAPNDFTPIFRTGNIRAVFCNGKQSYHLYQKYCAGTYRVPAFSMPSTSPANAAWNMERLTEAWRGILPYLEG